MPKTVEKCELKPMEKEIQRECFPGNAFNYFAGVHVWGTSVNKKVKELREVIKAIGTVKVFTEFRSTVLRGRADIDFKVIIFTFGIDFFPPFCPIKQDLHILSFPIESKATATWQGVGLSSWNSNQYISVPKWGQSSSENLSAELGV